MRICLATAHSLNFNPLALLYLKAYLVERAGLAAADISIVEMTPSDDPQLMADRLLATNPDVIGFSIYLWNRHALLAVAQIVKRRRPDVRIVLGGPEVGPVAADVMAAHASIDVVVHSEGEIPFAELVTAWQRSEPIDAVKGITRRHGDRLIEHEPAQILKDLNELPSPHQSRYGEYHDRIICIETQRGCVFRCNFCFYNKDLSIRNRRFDLERVKREVAFWLEQDVQQIYFMDPIFNLNAPRAKEICRFIAANNHRGIPIHAEIWAEFVDEELARLMKAANFAFLEVGLQSTDTDVLATTERPLRLKAFIEGAGHLSRFDLFWELHLIHGLPGDTPAAFRDSLDLAMSLDPPDIAVFPLMVLPGTELWRKAAALEVEFDREPPYFIRSHGSMDRTAIEYGHQVSSAVRLLARSRAIRILAREPGIKFSELAERWVAWPKPAGSDVPLANTVRAFVADVCRRNQVAADFYLGAVSVDFRASSRLPEIWEREELSRALRQAG